MSTTPREPHVQQRARRGSRGCHANSHGHSLCLEASYLPTCFRSATLQPQLHVTPGAWVTDLLHKGRPDMATSRMQTTGIRHDGRNTLGRFGVMVCVLVNAAMGFALLAAAQEPNGAYSQRRTAMHSQPERTQPPLCGGFEYRRHHLCPIYPPKYPESIPKCQPSVRFSAHRGGTFRAQQNRASDAVDTATAVPVRATGTSTTASATTASTGPSAGTSAFCSVSPRTISRNLGPPGCRRAIA